MPPPPSPHRCGRPARPRIAAACGQQDEALVGVRGQHLLRRRDGACAARGRRELDVPVEPLAGLEPEQVQGGVRRLRDVVGERPRSRGRARVDRDPGREGGDGAQTHVVAAVGPKQRHARELGGRHRRRRPKRRLRGDRVGAHRERRLGEVGRVHDDQTRSAVDRPRRPAREVPLRRLGPRCLPHLRAHAAVVHDHAQVVRRRRHEWGVWALGDHHAPVTPVAREHEPVALAGHRQVVDVTLRADQDPGAQRPVRDREIERVGRAGADAVDQEDRHRLGRRGRLEPGGQREHAPSAADPQVAQVVLSEPRLGPSLRVGERCKARLVLLVRAAAEPAAQDHRHRDDAAHDAGQKRRPRHAPAPGRAALRHRTAPAGGSTGTHRCGAVRRIGRIIRPGWLGGC